ncbi:MAG TPA: hypothetical protein VGM98_24615, partial [Schlesneria sp.]
DAAEAYVCDMIRPLKLLVGDEYRHIEERVERAVAERFGLMFPWPDAVIRADRQTCACELAAFWPQIFTSPLAAAIHSPLSPERAEQQFLEMFVSLQGA